MTRFEHHARTVGLLTFVSRITGLARDASLSRVFGTSAVMDAFFFAFMVPNLFRRLFGEGALAAAFLPEFAALDRADPVAARRLATLTVGVLVGGLGAVVLVLEVILLLASRSAGPDAALAIRLTMIMLPYMPLVCLVAVMGAMLQVYGRFGPTAAAPIVLNGCLVGITLGFAVALRDDRATHASLLAAGVLLAGALQVAWSLAALRGDAWRADDLRRAREPFRRVLRQAGPMIVGLGVLQVNTFVDGLIAGYPTVVGPTIFGVDYPLEAGAISAVNFAQRLYQFPLGVFGIAIATAIFPALARLVGDTGAYIDVVRRGLRLVVFIGLPASAGLLLVRDPLTAVFLEGGRFTAADTGRVGAVLMGYAPAIWAYSMMHVLGRAFYARQDAATPVKVAVATVALNLVLNCTLIWTPLREAGLAWSTAICSVLQALVLTWLLTARLGPVIDRAVAASWGRALVATGAMTAAVLVGARWLPAGSSWTVALASLLALVAGGAAVYVAAAAVLRMPEGRWLLHRDR